MVVKTKILLLLGIIYDTLYSTLYGGYNNSFFKERSFKYISHHTCNKLYLMRDVILLWSVHTKDLFHKFLPNIIAEQNLRFSQLRLWQSLYSAMCQLVTWWRGTTVLKENAAGIFLHSVLYTDDDDSRFLWNSGTCPQTTQCCITKDRNLCHSWAVRTVASDIQGFRFKSD